MPQTAQPFAGEAVQFSAAVRNAPSSAVTWEVNQITGGNPTVGTISSTGKYTAPNSVPNPSTVTVSAVLQANPSESATASVTIQALSSIQGPLTLSPALSSVTTSQTQQLNVVTAGVTNSGVNWSVDGIPNGNATVGEITATGLYTPPGSAGAHLVTATLVTNTSVTGSAHVEVTDFAGTLTWRNDNSRSE